MNPDSYSSPAASVSLPHSAGVRQYVPQFAALVFAAAWLLLAVQPLFPRDWALENLLSLLTAWWLLRRHRRAPFSNTAYVLLLVFGLLHEIGAHYTYAEVPYETWFRIGFGSGPDEWLDLSRNQYDRVVHFAFGLLCFRAMREALPPTNGQMLAGRWLTVAVLLAMSALYELVEWAAALLFGGELGQAYLGTQGDVWDAQSDMAMALLGALMASVLGGTLEARRAVKR